jgi:hypothetical protein
MPEGKAGRSAGMEMTSEILARVIAGGLELYAAAGALLAIAFVCFGVQKLDPGVQSAGIGFRLLILPGVAAFWPMFLSRWVRGTPIEIEGQGEER